MRITLYVGASPVGELPPPDGDASQGTPTLAQAIWLSGLAPPPPLCSGLGRCGHCRVRVAPPELAPPPTAEEAAMLTAQELARGWRLACRHTADCLSRGTSLHLPAAPRHTPHGTAPDASPGAAPSAAPVREALLAVDVGTTNLCWQALAPDGAVLAAGQQANPQMGAGADVLSRLAHARTHGGRTRLVNLIRTALADIVASLPCPVREMCLAANTAMTALCLDADVSGLAAAPYTLPVAGNCRACLPGLPPAYIPPQLAPFVGGDVSAGMALLRECPDATYPFLLADMGTNGEFVLALDGENAIVTSVPLGPALEGIGLPFGDVAGSGVVTHFALGPAGLVATTLDGAPPRRICGAGYLSLARCLLQAGVLGSDGRFATASPLPLARRLLEQLDTSHGEARLPLPGSMYCAASDVEEILKVKAAFSVAVESLLVAARLEPGAVRRVYLAGAMGEHVAPDTLEALGFLPHGLARCATATGNTALRGAALLLLKPHCRAPLAAWSRRCRILDIANAPDFSTHYLRHMRFAP